MVVTRRAFPAARFVLLAVALFPAGAFASTPCEQGGDCGPAAVTSQLHGPVLSNTTLALAVPGPAYNALGGIEAKAANSSGLSLASGERLRRTVYVDVGTLLISGNGSINVEEPLGASTLLRLGLGLGYLLPYPSYGTTTRSWGLLAMVNVVNGGTRSGFECGLGGSFMRINGFDVGGDYFSRSGWRPFPALTAGYRHESPSGGFLFRTGLGFTYAFGAGLYVSLGASL